VLIVDISSAPLLVQALAKDNIIPLLRPFAKIHNGEPRMALLFVVIIAEGVVLIGNLDFVATIVTQLYLIAYLFVNLSTGMLTLFNLASAAWILCIAKLETKVEVLSLDRVSICRSSLCDIYDHDQLDHYPRIIDHDGWDLQIH
jgi:hypothetical protein